MLPSLTYTNTYINFKLLQFIYSTYTCGEGEMSTSSVGVTDAELMRKYMLNE
jgi:hypothetical protein